MMWPLSARVSLANPRIPEKDAIRQTRTAEEILCRFDHQPGLVLADEVGMGKTFVALAVAASIVEATRYKHPVVVMVPTGVAEKWPREWDVFRRCCLRPGREIRATDHSVSRPAEFLKLLDNPAEFRKHIIFMTHGALTNSLVDPFVRLALIRQALHKRRSLNQQRRALPRWAYQLTLYSPFKEEQLVDALLNSKPDRWADVYRRYRGEDLGDDPVPFVLMRALRRVNTQPLRDALAWLPVRMSKSIEDRLKMTRQQLRDALQSVWRECLSEMKLKLPLLILDEAHHAKNPYTRLANLFADHEGEQDAEALRGPLSRVFARMLFMTATPFQLGHHELLSILERFDSIHWQNQEDRAAFSEARDSLRQVLDEAHTSSLRLDTAWSKLKQEDVATLPTEWWKRQNDSTLPDAIRAVATRIHEVEGRMRQAEAGLRPWVIRHTRQNREGRRSYHHGRAIVEENANHRGLAVAGRAVLPFLLASRAQALLVAEGLYGNGNARAYFAEGLASSFEAYRDTRAKRDGSDLVDVDGEELGAVGGMSHEMAWYLDNIDRALPRGDDEIWVEHPKMKATVARTLALWRAGEKVVVFCFFIATGRALRNHISRALKAELVRVGAEKLGLRSDEPAPVMEELDHFGLRFFDPDAPVTRLAEQLVDKELADLEIENEERRTTRDVVLRFLRTPSFLVRYVDIANPDRAAALEQAFAASDESGLALSEKIRGLGEFLAQRVPEERAELLEALGSIQTGTFFGARSEYFDAAEVGGQRAELLPNVRLANGGVPRDVRRRLMLTFNTPFFPDILVASAVMAEGVDLHLNCRYVIHHDLDWNPSVLEQRTGRVDRLGCKSEQCHQPIGVFEPYVEATQDEKQFLVVKEREKWFSVVMGDRGSLSEHRTEREAGRARLPDAVAKRLQMKLDVDGRR